MIYILYNPKAHSGNNDLNIVHKGETVDKPSIKKINLLELDVAAFASGLVAGDRVLIRGGDGTLHHFANHARGVEFPCPVVMIRSGTGNDFLNDIGQLDSMAPVDIREYLRDLPVATFAGKELCFVNGVGLGVDGAVCHGVELFKEKKPDKKANYTAIALQEITYKYQRPTARVTVDGVSHRYTDVWAVSTMKGKYYGGGMMISPSQDRDSGKVSVMVMHGGSRVKALAVFAKIKNGGHIKHTEMVEVFEGYDVKVEFSAPNDLQIDGEVYTGITRYSVHCNKKDDIVKNVKIIDGDTV